MFKEIYSQQFYNMLISPLDEIKDEVTAGNFQGAVMKASVLMDKLKVETWCPFPDYQSILTKLNFKEYTLLLCKYLLLLSNREEFETNKAKALKVISLLTPMAHLLNMLDVTYKTSHQVNAKMFVNTGKMLGLFNQVPAYTYDCNSNRRFVNKNEAPQEVSPSTGAYEELMSLLRNFMDERLRLLCQLLFSTMESMENDSYLTMAHKFSEGNLFVQGYVERMFLLSNVYKEQFRKLIAELSHPAEQHDHEDATTSYDVLNKVIDRYFH